MAGAAVAASAAPAGAGPTASIGAVAARKARARSAVPKLFIVPSLRTRVGGANKRPPVGAARGEDICANRSRIPPGWTSGKVKEVDAPRTVSAGAHPGRASRAPFALPPPWRASVDPGQRPLERWERGRVQDLHPGRVVAVERRHRGRAGAAVLLGVLGRVEPDPEVVGVDRLEDRV